MSEPAPRWQVIIHREPEKVLRKLPVDLVKRIWSRIRELESDPRPTDGKKMVGYENLYRWRAGDWRISYAVEENRLIIVVLEIAPRGGAYRNY